MLSKDHAKQCSLMANQELVAALTIERDRYTAQFHLAAQAELQRRKIKISEYKDRVGIRVFGQEERTGSIAESVRVLDEGVGEGDILKFSNCVGQALIFQQGISSLLGHYIDRGEYVHSFTIRPSQRPADILKTFLDLQDWTGKIEENFNLYDWEILIDSNSKDNLDVVQQLLAQRKILSLFVNTRLWRLFFERSDYYDSMPFKILVPKEALDDAQNVLQELDARIRDLQRLADELAGGKDRLKELDVLSELTKLVPADERAHYRRGVILLGLDRYREAADAFIASLENNSGHEQLFNGAYRGLEQIAAKLPDDVHLLHTLATFSVTHSKDPKSIEKYYKKILAIQPQDALAHLRLGYLYYELGDDISAYLHFKRYLELEPASDERETLVEIFGQLRSIVPTKDGFFGENNAV